jgi:bla regulator protein BlaR1
MTWLVAIGLTNAALASVLAILAWVVGRYARRPALARLLWILVLCKLLAPPLYKPSVGNWFSAPQWLSRATDEVQPAATGVAVADVSHRSEAGFSTFTPGAETTTPQSSTGAAQKTPLSALGSVASRLNVQRRGWFSRLATVSPAEWLRYATGIWLCGSALYIVWLAIRTWHFRRFLARVARADGELSQRVARLAHDAGLSSAPRVLVVESAVSPMLWGAGQGACLLFPAELVRRVDPAACDTLLLHELAHYARADWLVRVLELTAQVVYWWHPLVWWTLRHIEAAEEECCDAWVVKHRAGGRRVYAEALLTTLDFLCEPLPALPPAACGLGAAGSLRSRLTQIMCGEVAIRPSRAAKSLVLAIAAVALPLSPSIVGPTAREAAALGTPPQALAPAVARAEIGNVAEAPVVASEASSEAAVQKHWFVPRDLAPRPVLALYATAVAPNGRYQLEARTGHRAALVNVVSKERLDLSAYRILAASFSPDSRLLATGQDDESAVRLWDADTGEVRALLKGSEATITAVAFAPDGLRVAAGAADGSVLIWTVGEEDAVARLPRQDAPVSCLRWSKTGDRLAIALSEWSNRDSSSLVVWRPGEAAVSKEVPLDHSLGALDWLDDEAVLVADWSGAAQVVDLASGMPVESFWLSKDSVSAAAFSPDCRLTPRWQAMAVER